MCIDNGSYNVKHNLTSSQGFYKINAIGGVVAHLLMGDQGSSLRSTKLSLFDP